MINSYHTIEVKCDFIACGGVQYDPLNFSATSSQIFTGANSEDCHEKRKQAGWTVLNGKDFCPQCSIPNTSSQEGEKD